MRIYYGLPGIGKSINLIKTFKYLYDHTEFGTLYINCKVMKNNFCNNFNKMKKILKDEIVYLFQNEYKQYKICLNWVDNLNAENGDIWNIIKSLIKKFCINKYKKYIFIFDQYNYELDITKELYTLNEFLKNKNNQYGIIACCSMNNKSIRELKIQNLYGEEKLNNFPDNIKIKELKHLFDVSQLNIDNGGIYAKIYEKLGKTIKNNIILTKYYDNNDYVGLKEYLENEKNI